MKWEEVIGKDGVKMLRPSQLQGDWIDGALRAPGKEQHTEKMLVVQKESISKFDRVDWHSFVCLVKTWNQYNNCFCEYQNAHFDYAYGVFPRKTVWWFEEKKVY